LVSRRRGPLASALCWSVCGAGRKLLMWCDPNRGVPSLRACEPTNCRARPPRVLGGLLSTVDAPHRATTASANHREGVPRPQHGSPERGVVGSKAMHNACSYYRLRCVSPSALALPRALQPLALPYTAALPPRVLPLSLPVSLHHAPCRSALRHATCRSLFLSLGCRHAVGKSRSASGSVCTFSRVRASRHASRHLARDTRACRPVGRRGATG
jgi:hypothetical protein